MRENHEKIKCWFEMTDVKAAIIGCGDVVDGHLRAWKKIKGVKVSAVVDINENAARMAAERWNIPNYFFSLSDLLKKCEVEIIDICTPPHTHAALAVEAMENGSNIILEKPMAMTLKDAEDIVKSWKKSGVKAGVIHNWLFEPPMPDVKSLIDKGKLGEILHVDLKALNTRYDRMAMNKDHWCHRLQGGRLGEMLAHPIYLIKHFLKDVSLIDLRVSKLGDYTWMKSDELIASFKAGAKYGTFYASFNTPRQSIFLNIFGSEAIAQLDLINVTAKILPRKNVTKRSTGIDILRQTGQLMKYTMKNVIKIVTNRWMTGHDLFIQLYAQSILEDVEPPVSIDDGYEVVKILVEMYNKIEKEEDNEVT